MGEDDKTYDYIICGGGTAGCVIAGRLSEQSSLKVLLLEAGGSAESVPASAIPAAYSTILGTEADWNIESVPCTNLNNRRLHLGRGKFIGGSSGCNGTLCIRGSHLDYDAWGLDGWSGKDMYKFMSKAEAFHNKPWFSADEKGHGHDGPVKTAPHDPAPISRRVLESYQSSGLPLLPDMFTSGENAPRGCGHVVRTIHEGVRTTSAAYLANAKSRKNLEIMTKVHVDRVILASIDDEIRACGVIFKSASGDSTAVRARKEVIVCAGAYCSPAILLRSGIGATCELEKYGIKTWVDLPGVGKNLLDHLTALTFYEVATSQTTNDHLIWHGDAKARSMEQWHMNHTGFFSQFPFGTFAFARLDRRLEASSLWQQANRTGDLDPMGLLPDQPHVEF